MKLNYDDIKDAVRDGIGSYVKRVRFSRKRIFIFHVVTVPPRDVFSVKETKTKSAHNNQKKILVLLNTVYKCTYFRNYQQSYVKQHHIFTDLLFLLE